MLVEWGGAGFLLQTVAIPFLYAFLLAGGTLCRHPFAEFMLMLVARACKESERKAEE
jgi:hypothetical protein